MLDVDGYKERQNVKQRTHKEKDTTYHDARHQAQAQEELAEVVAADSLRTHVRT